MTRDGEFGVGEPKKRAAVMTDTEWPSAERWNGAMVQHVSGGFRPPENRVKEVGSRLIDSKNVVRAAAVCTMQISCSCSSASCAFAVRWSCFDAT